MKKINHSPVQTVRMLSLRTNLPQRQIRAVFTELADMARKETASGPFPVPGLGKLEITRRSARTGYNIHTGRTFSVPAKAAVRMRLLPKLSESILAPIREAEARAAEEAKQSAATKKPVAPAKPLAAKKPAAAKKTAAPAKGTATKKQTDTRKRRAAK